MLPKCLTPLPPAARLAHGVPEGSKVISPKTDKTTTQDASRGGTVGKRDATRRVPPSLVPLSRSPDDVGHEESVAKMDGAEQRGGESRQGERR